jgi:hypothetical protein
MNVINQKLEVGMEKCLRSLSLVALIFVMALSACSGLTEKNLDEAPERVDDGGPPVAAVVARGALAVELGIASEDIEIISHEQKVWSDSCLELGGIAESCLRTDVDGWLIHLLANGETFKAHTDSLGDQIRFEE